METPARIFRIRLIPVTLLWSFAACQAFVCLWQIVEIVVYLTTDSSPPVPVGFAHIGCPACLAPPCRGGRDCGRLALSQRAVEGRVAGRRGIGLRELLMFVSAVRGTGPASRSAVTRQRPFCDRAGGSERHYVRETRGKRHSLPNIRNIIGRCGEG